MLSMENSFDKGAVFNLLQKLGADYQDGHLNNSVVENMLEKWKANKAHIFKFFGNSLKVSKEIEMTLPKRELRNIINDFADKLLKENPKLALVSSFLYRVDELDFANNNLSRDVKFLDFKASKGTRISKVLNGLCLKEHSQKLQVDYSMVIQSCKGKGKVVISIDPSDYLTMSSNASGWRSCHRLDGGEFRTGPISYLQDSSSIICYIESKIPLEVGEYSYTNKIWRQMAMINPGLEYIVQERQYPNENNVYERAVSEMFKELLEKDNQVKYTYKSTNVRALSALHNDIADISNVCRYHYNDIESEMFEEGNLVYPTSFPSDTKSIYEMADYFSFKLPVKGSEVICLDCGKPVKDTESLFCYRCY